MVWRPGGGGVAEEPTTMGFRLRQTPEMIGFNVLHVLDFVSRKKAYTPYN